MRLRPLLSLSRPATAAALLAVVLQAAAQPQPSASGIYTCIDDKGRRLTSDRPIAECTAKEQHILNRDGSVRAVQGPTLTADERAALEARERKAAADAQALKDAVRRDKNLLLRYRDEASHRRAREVALDNVRAAIRTTEERLRELQLERKPLDSELEFYKSKAPPAKLKGQIEANDAALDAQRDVATQQQAELERVNRIYDLELARLRQLWAGALPGSMAMTPTGEKPASGPDKTLPAKPSASASR